MISYLKSQLAVSYFGTIQASSVSNSDSGHDERMTALLRPLTASTLADKAAYHVEGFSLQDSFLIKPRVDSWVRSLFASQASALERVTMKVQTFSPGALRLAAAPRSV